MSKNDSKLVTKVSPLIEGQVPDFVQSDHPVFVRFLKHYYQYLEAGRITLDTPDIDYIIQETTTTNYILNADGDRVVTESGAGSTSNFVENETVTGATSGATATVLLQDLRNNYLYISSQQKFITGETITGATSGATGAIKQYRANPVQNIQQLLEYANTDNTIYDFLDEFRNSFMNAIPNTLASGVSKRNLIKSIKDLYAAKGTSEGHKLFMRLFVGEQPEIFYPTENVLRTSDGNWGRTTTMRVTPNTSGVSGAEVIDAVITGATSGATATVVSSLSFQQGTESITEFTIENVSGTFSKGEIVSGLSSTRDLNVKFTISSIISSASVGNDGILHSVNEPTVVESLGNGFGDVLVSEIHSGSVSEVKVDDAGTSYEVGDTLTFTESTSDNLVESASGFVSMVGGGIQLESGTLDDPTFTSDSIILESGTQTHLESFNIQLENILDDNFIGDGTTTVFTLTNLNTTTDTIIVTIDDVNFPETDDTLTSPTNWTASGTTLTFTTAPADGAKIYVRGNVLNNLILDGTDGLGANANHQILTDTVFEAEDTHTTETDQIVLESDTFSTAEAGAIQKVHVANGGDGYTKLPTVTITTTSGTGASVLATTSDIGGIKSLKVSDSGFNFTNNAPTVVPRAHFVLKDVSGTFTNGNTLTSHVGTVKSFDSNTNVLDTEFENVIRVEQESTATFNEGIDLEVGTNTGDIAGGILLEDTQDFDDGEDVLLDGTSITTPSTRTITKKVTVVRNASDTANIFAIDSVPQPTLRLTEGNTYYFDLSDSSLYNAVSSKNHQLKFSITPNGTHGGGSEYTDGVTTSASYIDIGTTGAYIQIVVASGAPDLYYYCVNHSGMGGLAYTPDPQTTIEDESENVLLDASQTAIRGLLLEDGTDTGLGFLMQESLAVTRESRIGFNQTASGGVDQNDNILLEVGSNDGQDSILVMEENEPRVTLTGFSDTGDRFILEVSDSSFIAPESGVGVIKLDRYQENLSGQFLLLDGIDSDGTAAGEVVAIEEAGNRLILNGTDSDSTDANSNLLGEDETGTGDILLDGTDSSSSDAGDNIINEDAIDFSKDNVVITDNTGATGTIIKADIATASSQIGQTSTSEGSYSGIKSLIGEDLIRVQDSYYYQDYSYEVQVGEAFGTYVNELKKAVHPAGFRPFGKVSIASAISVAVTNAGATLSGFTGDDRFSPILASTFETIFDQVIKSRLEVAPDGDRGDRDDTIILDGTDISSSNAGDNILFEGNPERDTNDDGGGRLMAETSHAPSGKAERVLVKRTKVDISTRPTVRAARNLLLQLAQNPFGSGQSALQLENSTEGSFESGNLVIDGTLPFNDPNVPILLEGDEDRDHVVLNATDGSGTDDGGNILMEDGSRILQEDSTFVTRGLKDRILLEQGGDDSVLMAESDTWAFPVGYYINEHEKILLEDDHDDTSVKLSDVNSLTFNDILNKSKIIINDNLSKSVEQNNANAIENTGVLLEDFGQLILDGTDSTSSNAGNHLLQETTKRNRFTLELSGSLIEEEYSSNSVVERILLEGENSSLLNLESQEDLTDDSGIKLEIQGTSGDDVIILNGTGIDDPIPNAGDKVLLEDSLRNDTASELLLESTNLIISEGQIPIENWTLNSSVNPVGAQPIVQASEIVVRTTGDIALEDETINNIDGVTSHGYLVLNGTDSTSSNAGDNFDLEGATGITV
jgi:hypothetical protein